MMQDDMITIHDKATALYDRIDNLTVNGELTVEQLVILDEALSLWVEAREAIAHKEYEALIAQQMREAAEEEESREDFYDWMIKQVMEEEALVQGDFEDWPNQHDVDVAMSEYDREDRV